MTAAATTPNYAQSRAALTGYIKYAPLGTSVPTDVTTAWAAGWTDLGLIDDKGLDEGHKRSMNKVMAWQSPMPIRQLQKERDRTYKFASIQLNWATYQLWSDANTSTVSGGIYSMGVPPIVNVGEYMLGIEWHDGTYVYREFTQRGLFTDSADITLEKGSPVLSGLTYEVMPIDLTTLVIVTLTNDPAFASS
jgi:hypothetical protein